MTKISRVLDTQVLGEEASQGTVATSFTENVFGDITNCDFVFEDKVQVVKGTAGGTTSGHLPSKLIDLTHTPTGSLSAMPHDLKFLKYILTGYSESSPNYTITNADTSLPTSLSIKGTYDNSNIIQVVGNYFNNLRLNLNTDEIVTYSVDTIGIKPSSASGSVSYNPPTTDPLIFTGGTMSYDSKEWDISKISLTINPKFIQKWSCKTISAGDKRFPNEIIRGGGMDISFDGSANINSLSDELTKMWGGSSPSDSRSDVDIVLTFASGSKTHTLTISGRTTKAQISQTGSEEDAKQLGFAGVGKSVSVTGEL